MKIPDLMYKTLRRGFKYPTYASIIEEEIRLTPVWIDFRPIILIAILTHPWINSYGISFSILSLSLDLLFKTKIRF